MENKEPKYLDLSAKCEVNLKEMLMRALSPRAPVPAASDEQKKEE